MKKNNFIKTERLFITPLTAEDNRFIFELVNTEGWLTFIGNRNVATAKDASAYVENINSNKNIKYWVVRSAAEEAIGIVTLIKRQYLQHPDIGFAFLPQFSNNGYAYEATKAVLHLIAQQKKYKQVSAITKADNEKSIRLLRKLRFQFEKNITDNNEELNLYSVSLQDYHEFEK